MGNDQIVEVEDCGWVHGNAQLPLDRSLRDENDKKPVSIRGVDRGIHYSFFGGRIVLGPDYKAVFASIFLIVAPLGTDCVDQSLVPKPVVVSILTRCSYISLQWYFTLL
jgi:hypothetical protein